MSDGSRPVKKIGRPPKGTERGSRINLYLTQPREELFEEAFNLLKEKGILPSTAVLSRSRATIVDHALDALIEKLRDPEA